MKSAPGTSHNEFSISRKNCVVRSAVLGKVIFLQEQAGMLRGSGEDHGI